MAMVTFENEKKITWDINRIRNIIYKHVTLIKFAALGLKFHHISRSSRISFSDFLIWVVCHLVKVKADELIDQPRYTRPEYLIYTSMCRLCHSLDIPNSVPYPSQFLQTNVGLSYSSYRGMYGLKAPLRIQCYLRAWATSANLMDPFLPKPDRKCALD